ncbi:MAG: hypothetical protein J6T01_05085 [Kiritimatiellae bacterium]|nr:hypothetical protein [Kiritimatiellia bacterium]
MRFLVCLATAAVFAVTSQAANKYWRGTVNSSAANAGNWSDEIEWPSGFTLIVK